MKISVVVPTYKRPELLKRCVDALERQDFARDQYEILVCEDVNHEGPAAVRNRGWRQAKGEIVAFTDDDCIPDSGWLKAGYHAMKYFSYDAAAGKIIVPLPPKPTDYERDTAGLERAEFATANCFYRREVLKALGGFDERFKTAWREDGDLYLSALEKRFRCGTAPQAVVIHPVRPAPWGVSIAQQRKTIYNALLYKKHRALYSQKIPSQRPLLYYFILLSLVLFAAGFKIALLSWLLLTSYFCVKRLRGTTLRPSHLLEMAWTSILIPPLSVFWRLAGAVKYRVLYW